MFSLAAILPFAGSCDAVVHGAGEQESGAQSGIGVIDTAAVVIDGHEILTVRGIAVFPAERRAREIRRAIIAVAEDETIPSVAVTLEEKDDRTDITAGERFLLDLFDEDAALDGVSRRVLAETVQLRLRKAITDYRLDRKPRTLTIKSLYALATTVVAAGLFFGFRKEFRSIDRGAIRLKSFKQEWALPTYRILRLLVIIFAVVVAYPCIPGSESEAFKGISILLGLIVSLGSSSIIANIIAGCSMAYRRPFRVGDRVKIDDTVGEVIEIRILVTRLRSLKNEEVVIPNTTILSGEVVNDRTLAEQQGLILHTSVETGYETPWRQVEAMLKLAAFRTPRLLEQPELFVLRKELGNFAVVSGLNVFCSDPANMAQIYSALHDNILDVFNK